VAIATRRTLDPDKVRQMRRIKAEGWNYNRLAIHFSVTQTTAYRVCRRLAWKDVE